MKQQHTLETESFLNFKNIRMNETLFFSMIGHLIGDFFFQFKVMADNKWRAGAKGFAWCSLHVTVYTVIVCLFAGNLSLLFFAGVFLPHWVIDRWSLASVWMRFTGSATLLKGTKNTDVPFAVAIYIVTDQTMHFLCLYTLIRFFPVIQTVTSWE